MRSRQSDEANRIENGCVLLLVGFTLFQQKLKSYTASTLRSMYIRNSASGIREEGSKGDQGNWLVQEGSIQPWFWKECAGLWVKKFKSDLGKKRGHKASPRYGRAPYEGGKVPYKDGTVPYKKFEEWSVLCEKFEKGGFDPNEISRHYYDFRKLYAENNKWLTTIEDANDNLLAKYDFATVKDYVFLIWS